MDNKKYIWDFLFSQGFSEQGIAAIMGNMQKESNFIVNNVEDRAPYSDEQYTKMVDDGTYTNFVYDQYGYGLVQWTYWSLKKDLLNYCKKKNKSISDINCQLEQLLLHMKQEGVYDKMKNATSIEKATVQFLKEFEKPADQSNREQQERTKYAINIYNEFQGKGDSSMSDFGNNIINNNIVYEDDYIKKGDEGSQVKDLQEKLIQLGYSVGPDGADGDFGKNTLAAVLKFQEDNNLEVDGIVGPETKKAIELALKKSTVKIYRIRKSWYEPRTQVGAYNDLNKAIESWNKLPNGYYVYDNNGIIVYPTDAEQEKDKNKFNPIVRPAKTYNDVALGMAAKDERNDYRNGEAGDQTGKEVYVLQTWYDQNWTSVLRPNDPQLAEKIAQSMEAACANPNIGYDQNQRNTLYIQAKKVGYDLSKVDTPCECDCSSLVSICCICAGLPENVFYPGGNMRTTYDMEEACLMTGKFSNLTESKYTKQKDYLKRGDILLNRDQHVVVVLGNGSLSGANTTNNDYTEVIKVRINTNVLNVRSMPIGTAPVVGRIYRDSIYALAAMENGWGKIKSKNGWINLEYVVQVK